jgi:predicted PurR-regulated permease PerM
MVDTKVDNRPRSQTFRDRFTLVAASLLCAAVIVAICAGMYLVRNVLIIFLLAVLFAIFLTKTASALSGRWKLNYEQSLSLVLVALISGGCGSLWLLGSRIRSEIGEASEHVDEAKVQLRQKLQEFPAAQSLLQQTPMLRDWTQSILASDVHSDAEDSTSIRNSLESSRYPSDASGTQGEAREGTDLSSSGTLPAGEASVVAARDQSDRQPESPLSGAQRVVRSVASEFLQAVGQAVKSTLGLILNSLIIFFVGLFLAITPDQSRDGIASLAPQRYRDEWRRVLDCLADSLWRWLIGRLASMLITGTGVGIALALLGVPLPATLGLLTCLLTFIPNIGAAIALTLAVFMAIPSGLTTMAWVVVIYLAFQLLESYAFTPLIQQYQVSVPPALLIGAQAVFGVLLGFLGAMVASPIVVIALVLKREVYQRHWLQEH